MSLKISQLPELLTLFIGKDISQIIIEYRLPKKIIFKCRDDWFSKKTNFINSIRILNFHYNMCIVVNLTIPRSMFDIIKECSNHEQYQNCDLYPMGMSALNRYFGTKFEFCEKNCNITLL